MSYVDLDPIRAGLAQTPEQSDFTSVQERITAFGKSNKANKSKSPRKMPTPNGLLAFSVDAQKDKATAIPLSFVDYLQLTVWTGRALRDGKRGVTPADIARLGIASDAWLDTILHYSHRCYRVVGAKEKIKRCSVKLGQHWLCGLKAAQQMYKPGLHKLFFGDRLNERN